MLLVEEVPALFAAWKQRQSDRDDRIDVMSAIMRGDFAAVFDPDEEQSANRSPNMIHLRQRTQLRLPPPSPRSGCSPQEL